MTRRLLALTLCSSMILPACAAPTTAARAPQAPAAPAVEEEPPPDHPRTWAEVPGFFGSRCPAPDFVLDEPLTKTVGGARWTVRGSRAERAERWSGPLRLGVLGAIKDATPATKANLLVAKAAFDKARVDAILCNGDVAETAEIHDVAALLGEVFGDDRPLLVHAGNSEWVGGFNEAFADLEQAHPAVFNLNFIRDLDFGGVHLLSLPGWSVREFVKEGGCRTRPEDIDAVADRARAVIDRGDVAILTAHGPPRGPDKKSLDATFDFGNVGDETLAALLQDGAVRFGIFGHILEAGGRATADAKTHKPLPLPLKKPSPSLFVNVGSASSVGLQLLDGRTSRGMAAVFVIDDFAAGGRATVSFVRLAR